MEEQKMQSIESLLPQGEENAIATKDLLAITAFPSARELQKQIQFERSQGAVILSSSKYPGGYYRPAECPVTARSEINAFVRTLQNRARNTYRIARIVQRSSAMCKPEQEQISFFG